MGERLNSTDVHTPAAALHPPALRRLRICHIASGDLWAGAEAQVAILLSRLVKHPICDVEAILLNDGRLARELKASGVTVLILNENQFSFFGIWKQVYAYLRSARIDILHTHRYKENVLGALAATFSGIPCIVRTVHGLPESSSGIARLKMKAYRYIDECIARYLHTTTIAVSSELCGLLRNRYGHESVVHIHNAADLSRIAAHSDAVGKRRDLGLDPGDRVIGTVGRLAPVKGIEHFLMAAKLMLQKTQDLIFLVVGEGPLRGSLERMARELRIDHRVRFLGHREDVYDLIDLMDVFAMPSVHEGLPTALLEALALGKPVVGTRVGGIPDVLREEGLGVLVEAKNPAQLADACLDLLNSRGQGARRAVERREYVARHFSPDTLAANTLALYDRLRSRAAVA